MIDSMMKAMGFHRVRNGTMDRFVNLERGDVFLFCGMIFRKIDEETAIAFNYAASNGMKRDDLVEKLDVEQLMDWLQWNL